MCVLEKVYKDDWVLHSNKNIYRGAYSVGRFEMSNEFILSYMSAIYDIDIKDEDVQSISEVSELNDKKILYMQMSDILTNHIINEIRTTVKNPPENYLIIRKGEKLLSIECLK